MYMCVCACVCVSPGAFMPPDIGEPINVAHNRLYASGLFYWVEGSDTSD